jgi:cytochrome c peroxidase
MPKSSRHSRRLPFLILAFLALLDPRASAGGRREVDYPESLKGQWVPRPTRLSDFVADGEALVTLGKSLFWDVGIGSDGQTACATCHGHAGVDPRRINTVHPGANGTFDTKTAAGELKTADFFPTTVFADPASRFSEVLRDLDDIAGSQGVLSRRFVGLDSGRIEEICDALPEAIFVLDGVAQRQVTGRNPPTVINAVFNIRNFWDGRANPWFNGRNGLGPVDPAARVWVANAAGTGLVPAAVMLDFSSLASQAVGPVLNPVEMSCAGRAWPDLAAKLLDRQPLATQRVRPDDSVLGPLVDADGLGLEVTYRELVDAAFLPHWRTSLPTPDGVPQVEANFPLIFGLAVQAYEARLVSDETRYDRFAEAGFPEDGGGFLDAEERPRDLHEPGRARRGAGRPVRRVPLRAALRLAHLACGGRQRATAGQRPASGARRHRANAGDGRHAIGPRDLRRCRVRRRPADPAARLPDRGRRSRDRPRPGRGGRGPRRGVSRGGGTPVPRIERLQPRCRRGNRHAACRDPA